jgi:hypothetical protein
MRKALKRKGGGEKRNLEESALSIVAQWCCWLGTPVEGTPPISRTVLMYNLCLGNYPLELRAGLHLSNLWCSCLWSVCIVIACFWFVPVVDVVGSIVTGLPGPDVRHSYAVAFV